MLITSIYIFISHLDLRLSTHFVFSQSHFCIFLFQDLFNTPLQHNGLCFWFKWKSLPKNFRGERVKDMFSYLVSPRSVGFHLYTLKALGIYFGCESCIGRILSHINALTKVYKFGKSVFPCKHYCWVATHGKFRTENNHKLVN